MSFPVQEAGDHCKRLEWSDLFYCPYWTCTLRATACSRYAEMGAKPRQTDPELWSASFWHSALHQRELQDARPTSYHLPLRRSQGKLLRRSSRCTYYGGGIEDLPEDGTSPARSTQGYEGYGCYARRISFLHRLSGLDNAVLWSSSRERIIDAATGSRGGQCGLLEGALQQELRLMV